MRLGYKVKVLALSVLWAATLISATAFALSPRDQDPRMALLFMAIFIMTEAVTLGCRGERARYPAYQLIDLPPTPIETIRKARDIGLRAGLRYVYQGNVPGEGENTYCYRCGELLIERFGYRIVKNRIIEPSCPRCGVKIDGVLK